MNADAQSAFRARLDEDARLVAAFLDERLGARAADDGFAWPDKLRAAMRHGVLNGGKRLRPFLVIETVRMLKGDIGAALQVGAALECIHCYSLIHDDLPAMDDDDLRRGQPTVHIAFDEATAILAGDALLTLAFELLSDPAGGLAPAVQIELVRRLAEASGAGGMVGGQVLDLAAEVEVLDEEQIARMQAMKTGALLRFACTAGALVAGADPATVDRLSRFGDRIGLAFQPADDLLDATASAEAMGKATGKDAGRNKKTFLALHGIEAARGRCDELVSEAAALLEPFGGRAAILKAAAAYVASRDH